MDFHEDLTGDKKKTYLKKIEKKIDIPNNINFMKENLIHTNCETFETLPAAKKIWLIDMKNKTKTRVCKTNTFLPLSTIKNLTQ